MPQTFEHTDAWPTARELTRTVHALCRREALRRDFSLCDQPRRAAISVMNNVAEGWESLHPAEKKPAYNYARRSCGEVRSMSYALLDNQFISESEHAVLCQRCVKAGQLVSGLIRSLDRR
jgi:four helix bundle protein